MKRFAFSSVRFALSALLAVGSIAFGVQPIDAHERLPLEDSIRALRSQGRYAEARDDAIRLLENARSGGAPAWQLTDAERLVAALTRVLELPESLRAELGRADSVAYLLEERLENERGAEDVATLEEVLRVRIAAFEPGHPEIALAKSLLAASCYAANDLERATLLQREALEAQRAALSAPHPDLAESYAALGTYVGDSGDLASSLEYLKTGVDMSRELFGDDDDSTARALGNLAILHEIQGDFSAAEAMHRNVLASLRRIHGPRHATVATATYNLARNLSEQGNFAAAEDLYLEALEIQKEILGEVHGDVADTMDSYGICLTEMDRIDEALAFHERALEIRREIGADEISLAAALFNASRARKELGLLEEAEAGYLEALEIVRRVLGERHRHVATCLNNLAILKQTEGDPVAAERYAREALELRREQLGEDHPQVTAGLIRVAEALGEQGRLAEAESLLVEAAGVYDRARLRVLAGETRVMMQPSPHALLASARVKQGKTEEAWEAADQALGTILSDALTADPHDLSPQDRARRDAAQAVLLSARNRLEVVEAAAEDSSTAAPSELDAARNDLLLAEASWSELELELAARHPMTSGQSYSLGEVQRSRDPETAIVGWLDLNWRERVLETWGYVLRSTGPVRWIPLSEAAGGEQPPFRDVDGARAEVASPSPTGGRDRCQTLYRTRVASLLVGLHGIRRLIVTPSSLMSGFPLEALQDESGQFLVDRFDVQYAPSAALAAWFSSEREKTDSRRALLVGDPAFRFDDRSPSEDQETGFGRSPLDPALARAALDRDPDALAKLPRLPGSRMEVEWIAGMVGSGAQVLVGSAATETALAELAGSGALQGCRFVHIASHALVDDRTPGRSCVVLSSGDQGAARGASPSTEAMDGFLTADEIEAAWTLDCELVTLSACETALGKEIVAEGFLGLTSAFLVAGSRAVLASLWQVEDAATALLMSRFYGNWLGGEHMTKTAALAEAKRWLRQLQPDDIRRELRARGVGSNAVARAASEAPPGSSLQETRPYSDPYYWAGFVLVGDGR